MLSQAARDFLLHITNYFHGHWEDPNWGRTPINQVLVGVTIRQLAEGLEDSSLRNQIQNAANEAIAKHTPQVARA
jgi:hypothetical protein